MKRLGDFFSQRQEPGIPGLPVMSVTMNDNLVLRDELDRRLESALRPEQHLLVKKGDIAYNMMRMWQGACGLATSDGIVSPAYVVLAPKPGIDSRFAYHWFKSDRMIYLFWAYSHGLTEDRLRLYFDEFAEIPADPPPIKSQQHIASVLNVWDLAAVELERLISAKKRRKVGIFAHIMSNCRAKRGFIHDLAEINPSNQFVSPDAQVSFVAMEDVSETGSLMSLSSRRRLELGNGYTQFAEGDILVAKITPCFENGKGALAVGLTNRIGFGTTEFHVIRPHDPADAEYLHQLTLTPSFRAAGERHMTGSAGQRRVPAAFIEDFPILIMDASTRRNTGQLLGTFDTEVRLLDSALGTIRKQKQSLMQKLLSDQWHLGERPDSVTQSATSFAGREL